jgi:hypothetical protein
MQARFTFLRMFGATPSHRHPPFGRLDNPLEQLTHTGGNGSDAIGEFNARLIVEAPAIFKALEALVEIGKRDLSNPKYESYFLAARAAIARVYFND